MAVYQGLHSCNLGTSIELKSKIYKEALILHLLQWCVNKNWKSLLPLYASAEVWTVGNLIWYENAFKNKNTKFFIMQRNSTKFILQFEEVGYD